MSIPEFYKGKNVFVTGATGFIGKLLIEKLLWSCPDIGNIYIIIRSKKDKNVQQRLEEIFESPVFDRIRKNRPEILKKVIAFNGNIALHNFGLSDENLEEFYKKINLIFHLAASIKFDDPIKEAFENNSLPTKMLIEMAKKCENFKAFVHVSTAYSNFYLNNTYEVPYLPHYDPNSVIKIVQMMPESFRKEFEPTLLNRVESKDKVRPFPNTYTYSKYLAEAFVVKEGEGVSRAIVRPSLVISTLNEPLKGWIDNWAGPTVHLANVSTGILRYLNCIPNMALDMVPGDMVVNCIIAAGWKTAIEKPKDVQIFNVSTSTSNPITMRKFSDLIELNARKFPYDHVIWWPKVHLTNNKFTALIMSIMFHKIPGYFVDLARKIRGKKPILLNLHKKLDDHYNKIDFCTKNVYFFHNEKSQKLAQSLSKFDQKHFPFDMKTINWNECIESLVVGVKKHLLKEDCSEDAFKKNREKIKRLKILHIATKAFFIGVPTLTAIALINQKIQNGKFE